MAGLEGLLRERLPPGWDYGVKEDGRVFFIDEQKQTTTWLHPKLGDPVQEGHDMPDDLPPGWSRGCTAEGVMYYIDHITRQTTFTHPITLEATALEDTQQPERPPKTIQTFSSHPQPQSVSSQSVTEGQSHSFPEAAKSYTEQPGLFSEPFEQYKPEHMQRAGNAGMPMSETQSVNPNSNSKSQHGSLGVNQQRHMESSSPMTSEYDEQKANSYPDERFCNQQRPEAQQPPHVGYENERPMSHNYHDQHRDVDDMHRNSGYAGPQRPQNLEVNAYRENRPPYFNQSDQGRIPQQSPSGNFDYQDRVPLNNSDVQLRNSPNNRQDGHPNTGNTYTGVERTVKRPAQSPQTPTTPQSPTSPKTPLGGKKPSHYRRGSGKHKVLDRTPTAQRSERSPVSMKGWLYKQDSTALKQWKKRWFVLADFCLFYYKGPDERQTLGSILLPSYKINPCLSEDNVAKKNAFKAQHQNMRTYIFAAESKEDMRKWMNVMSLATILQRDPNMEKEFNRTEGDGMSTPPVRQDGDAGFGAARPVRNALSSTPNDTETSYRSGSSSDMHRGRPLSEHYPQQHPERLRPLSEHYPVYSYDPKGGSPDSRQNQSGHFPNDNKSQGQGSFGQKPEPQFGGSFDGEQRPYSSSDIDKVLQRPEPQIPSSNRQSSYQGRQTESPAERYQAPSSPNRNPQLYAKHVQKQESLKQLREWSQNINQQKQPIYENVHNNTNQNSSAEAASPPPNRPPLPVHYKGHIAHEIAETKTPRTSKDILDSSQRSLGRVNEPLFFQYPDEEKRVEHQRRPGQQDNYDSAPGYNGKPAAAVNYAMLTVKEDPNMPDSQVVTTAPNYKDPNANRYINGHRLSITAEDLLGKSHEELVLMLIELRRNQTNMEALKNKFLKELEIHKSQEEIFQSQRNFEAANQSQRQMKTVKSELEEIQKQIEINKPMISLVDNMVKMGSLYGGENAMMATQYKKHILKPEQYTPPKKMIEFSRQLQETKHVHNMRADVKNLTSEQANLEEKQRLLLQLDKELQEMSFRMATLQDEKEHLEKILAAMQKQIGQNQFGDARQLDSLYEQMRNIERDYHTVMVQLTENSKKLEQVAAENAKVEQEVMILRSKVMSPLQRSHSTPTLTSEQLRAKMRIEEEVSSVQTVMDGLSKQGQKLSAAVNSLTNSNQNLNEAGTFNETDLDTMVTRNIAIGDKWAHNPSALHGERDQRNKENGSPLDISEADDNMKRFYGIIPKEKPKAQTVRDVKRENERKRLSRKTVDSEEGLEGEEASHEFTAKREESRGMIHSLPKPKTIQSKDSGKSATERLLGRRPSSELLYGPRPFSLNKASKSTTSIPKETASDLFRETTPISKKNARGRYMTISSSHPVAMETPKILKNVENELQKRSKDDQDVISSTDTKGEIIDEWTIDRELFAPEKVLIPERYMPDSEDEEISEEEKMRREEKAEKIRKMLSAHSLQEFTQLELNAPESKIHQKVTEEKKRREMVLELRHAIAREVTVKSKEVAAKRRGLLQSADTPPTSQPIISLTP